MKSIRTIMQVSLRGYRGTRKSAWNNSSKPERKIEMVQPNMPVDLNDVEEDIEDLDSAASDFSNVASYDKMHEKEEYISKLKLKQQIVKRKYFKSEEPAMLTWGEREQIRYLHKENPEEWTPERLSESFPASKQAVLKVLRANRTMKSTKAIVKYEQTVKQNWELLKAGKLVVDSKLKQHLENFKDRRINIMDEESIKKFVKPKPDFPKPQSDVFSSIIQNYLDENNPKESRNPDEKRAAETETTKQISSGSDNIATVDNAKRSGKSLTIDMFLQEHTENVQQNHMTTFDRVIVDEFKQRSAEAYKNKSLQFESQRAVGMDKPTPSQSEKSDTKICQPPLIRTIDEGSLETGIIAREKIKEAVPEDYPLVIKIPKKKFVRGATYRIQDRYYADDGEFLYKVPGIGS